MKITLQKIAQIFLVLTRLLLGVLFTLAGSSKLLAGSFNSETMIAFLHEKQDESFVFYQSFIENTVLSAPLFFAALVAFGELILGLALLVGAKVRLISAFGIIMLLNFSFAKGTYPWEWGADQVLIILLAVSAYFRAGHTWGIDALLEVKRNTSQRI